MGGIFRTAPRWPQTADAPTVLVDRLSRAREELEKFAIPLRSSFLLLRQEERNEEARRPPPLARVGLLQREARRPPPLATVAFLNREGHGIARAVMWARPLVSSRWQVVDEAPASELRQEVDVDEAIAGKAHLAHAHREVGDRERDHRASHGEPGLQDGLLEVTLRARQLALCELVRVKVADGTARRGGLGALAQQRGLSTHQQPPQPPQLPKRHREQPRQLVATPERSPLGERFKYVWVLLGVLTLKCDELSPELTRLLARGRHLHLRHRRKRQRRLLAHLRRPRQRTVAPAAAVENVSIAQRREGEGQGRAKVRVVLRGRAPRQCHPLRALGRDE